LYLHKLSLLTSSYRFSLDLLHSLLPLQCYMVHFFLRSRPPPTNVARKSFITNKYDILSSLCFQGLNSRTWFLQMCRLYNSWDNLNNGIKDEGLLSVTCFENKSFKWDTPHHIKIFFCLKRTSTNTHKQVQLDYPIEFFLSSIERANHAC
jgi:hypothetical protein